jgi:hypothetical protein
MEENQYWLDKLKQEHMQREIEAERLRQHEANRKRILAAEAPKIWRELDSCLENRINGLIGAAVHFDHRSRGLGSAAVSSRPIFHLSVARPGASERQNFIDLQIIIPTTYRGTPDWGMPDGVTVRFDSSAYRITVSRLGGSTEHFVFDVDLGKVVIRDGGGQLLRNDEHRNQVEELCRRILKPMMTLILG